ncbi:MAG: hypothetical protein L0177_18585, partial [Chloroflexi bacterium]|nr:hypothetical protein [Chloroflexota bacterium]
MSRFNHPALEQLTDQQVRFVPPARRMEQLARAERLLAETDPGKQYPYQFVCFRITDYRPDAYPDLLIALQHAPPLALLDEPTTALDPLMREGMFQVLLELRRAGHTI